MSASLALPASPRALRAVSEHQDDGLGHARGLRLALELTDERQDQLAMWHDPLQSSCRDNLVCAGEGACRVNLLSLRRGQNSILGLVRSCTERSFR